MAWGIEMKHLWNTSLHGDVGLPPKRKHTFLDLIGAWTLVWTVFCLRQIVATMAWI